MEITTELVKHLASLSRINFSKSEIEEFKTDFAKTLNQINELQSVDTTNIETFSRVINARDLQDDEIKSSLPVSDVIKNAEKSARGMIEVPRVVE